MRCLNAIYSALVEAANGDSPSSLRLLRHGVFWVLAAVGLDLGSSWLMMSIYGPFAEGNPIHRTLFMNPTFPVFLNWLAQQWSWFTIGFVGCLGILVVKAGDSSKLKRLRPLISKLRPMTTSLGLFVTWPMAFARLVLGLGSNVAGMLLPVGAPAQIFGWLAIVVLTVILMESDFLRLLLQRQTLQSGAAAGLPTDLSR